MMKFSFLNNRSRISDKDLKMIGLLLEQLSIGGKIVLNKKQVLLGVRGSKQLIVRESRSETIIGIGTLCVTPTLKALKGHIEDIVVDQNYRGQGIGRRILETLIAKAKEMGVKDLELTSNPLRIEANELYKKLGFELRDTNPYRMRF